ncbi:MAG: hypothetical protein E6043_07425, partial [Slackia sp.]|nr:hypothetical protein [Slackia sp.]
HPGADEGSLANPRRNMGASKKQDEKKRDPLGAGPMDKTQKYVLAGAVLFIVAFVLYYLFG